MLNFMFFAQAQTERKKQIPLCLPLENGEIKKMKKLLWHQPYFYIRLLISI